jgi:hypothetical protein
MAVQQKTPMTETSETTPVTKAADQQNTGMKDKARSADPPNAATSGIYDRLKETATDTYEAVASKTTSRLESGKSDLSNDLRRVADSFRRTGSELRTAGETNAITDMTGRYTGLAADKVEQVAGYFQRKDLRSIVRDAEAFARSNPAIFLGAAFGLGLLAARFLKSSPPGDVSRRQIPTQTGESHALPAVARPETTPPPMS